MKKSAKITFCAVMAALAVTVMLVSYFPYLTYAVPAVAGLTVMVALVEVGYSYAVFTYIVSAFLTLIFAEKESASLYLCLFGFYPILKAVIEKLNKPVFEWIIKLALFNACAVLSFFVASFVFGIPFDELNAEFKYGIYAFWALCNPVFVLYDIAVTRMAGFYFARLHKTVSKMFKR